MKSIRRDLIDRSLFLYGGLVAFILTIIAFQNIRSTTSLVTLILFLPVSIYFISRAVIIILRTIHSVLNKNRTRHPYFGDFSLKAFISQDDLHFQITLFLLSLAFAINLVKLSIQNLR